MKKYETYFYIGLDWCDANSSIPLEIDKIINASVMDIIFVTNNTETKKKRNINPLLYNFYLIVPLHLYPITPVLTSVSHISHIHDLPSAIYKLKIKYKLNFS